MNDKLKIFLSYAHEDIGMAKKFIKILRNGIWIYGLIMSPY